MSLDIAQLGFKLLKNLEKIIFFVLSLAWLIMSLTLVIKSGSSDKGGVITEVEMPRGEVVETAEGPAQWRDYVDQLKNPEKFSVYAEYEKIARKGIFKREKEPKIDYITDAVKVKKIPLPDEALTFSFDEVIVMPFPIKYMGMFRIGDKLNAQINWASKTYFVSEQDKIKNYTVNKIDIEKVEVEDAGGEKFIIPYKQQIYNEELKAVLSVAYTFELSQGLNIPALIPDRAITSEKLMTRDGGIVKKNVISPPKEELNEYTVIVGQRITNDKYTVQVVKITENDITLKVKYKIKQQITDQEKKEAGPDTTGSNTKTNTNTDTDSAAKKEIEIEKEVEFVLKLNETKVIDLTPNIDKNIIKTEDVNITEEQNVPAEEIVAAE